MSEVSKWRDYQLKEDGSEILDCKPPSGSSGSGFDDWGSFFSAIGLPDDVAQSMADQIAAYNAAAVLASFFSSPDAIFKIGPSSQLRECEEDVRFDGMGKITAPVGGRVGTILMDAFYSVRLNRDTWPAYRGSRSGNAYYNYQGTVDVYAMLLRANYHVISLFPIQCNGMGTGIFLGRDTR